MLVVSCYIVLSLITAFVILVSLSIIRKTSSLLLVVPIGIVYFWSIYGAWSWIPMKLNGDYDYYESIMYTVKIDNYYLESLVLYSLFLVILSFFMNHIANYMVPEEYKEISLVEEYKDYIDKLDCSQLYYSIIYFFLFVFVFFSAKDIMLAIRYGVSAYNLSRFDSTLGNFGSLIMFVGDTFLYLSVPLLFARKPLYDKAKIILPIVLYFIVNLLLGNRNTLMCGFLLGIIMLTEFKGIKSTITLKNIAICLIVLVGIQYISFIRGLSINEILSGNVNFSFTQVLNSTSESHEKYAAHISMYGVLKNNVPFTYGSSVLFLISTIIPSFVGVKRPDDIYHYFVMQTMGAKPEIGVTLHHATGWYLNFGVIGIVAGALLWGYVMKYMYVRKTNFVYFFGCAVFSAVSIQMIRGGGIDCYKGVLLLDTIIPMLIVYLCINRHWEQLEE